MIVVCQCNFTFVSFSSYSCGYRKVFEEYVGILRQKYPELQIEGENYNPPGYNMLIAKILVRIIVSSSVILTFHHRRHNNVFSQGLAKISLIVFIVSGFDLGQPLPSLWQWCIDNRFYSCIMIFFIFNAIEGQLISSGAFEIHFNGKQCFPIVFIETNVKFNSYT